MGLRTEFRRYLSPRAYLGRLLKRRSGMQVLRGPFQGMHYVQDGHGSAYLPKLIGTYEREINGPIEEVIAGDHDLLVDVGAAEGYFAVGLAMRSEAPVVAYEMSSRGRGLATELADKNGVSDRIDLRGECTADALEDVLKEAQRPFVLVDVEGAEAQLLNPASVPSLRNAKVLVEIHEFARPGISASLMRLFDATHEIQVFWEEERSAEEFPYSTPLSRLMPKRYLQRAVEEHRGHKQSWLWMTPYGEQTERHAA